MMKKFSVIVCLLVFTMVANAEIVVFQDRQINAYYPTATTDWETNGYQGTHDNYVSSYGSSRDYNMGQSSYMTAGNPGLSTTQAGLLKFDLTALAGQTIVGATLQIYSRGCGYADQEVTVHEMHPGNGGWVEGSKAGASATNDDSDWNWKDVTAGTTWNGGYGPVSWANPADPWSGVDFDPTVLATLMRTDNLNTSYQGWEFSLPNSIIQSWVDAPDVHSVAGLQFRASYMDIENWDPEVDSWHLPYCSESMVNFLSSDYATGQLTYSLLPKLTVEVVPEPMTMILVGLGGLFLRRRK